jgi:hypothetical protein
MFVNVALHIPGFRRLAIRMARPDRISWAIEQGRFPEKRLRKLLLQASMHPEKVALKAHRARLDGRWLLEAAAKAHGRGLGESEISLLVAAVVQAGKDEWLATHTLVKGLRRHATLAAEIAAGGEEKILRRLLASFDSLRGAQKEAVVQGLVERLAPLGRHNRGDSGLVTAALHADAAESLLDVLSMRAGEAILLDLAVVAADRGNAAGRIRRVLSTSSDPNVVIAATIRLFQVLGIEWEGLLADDQQRLAEAYIRAIGLADMQAELLRAGQPGEWTSAEREAEEAALVQGKAAVLGRLATLFAVARLEDGPAPLLGIATQLAEEADGKAWPHRYVEAALASNPLAGPATVEFLFQSTPRRWALPQLAENPSVGADLLERIHNEALVRLQRYRLERGMRRDAEAALTALAGRPELPAELREAIIALEGSDNVDLQLDGPLFGNAAVPEKQRLERARSALASPGRVAEGRRVLAAALSGSAPLSFVREALCMPSSPLLVEPSHVPLYLGRWARALGVEAGDLPGALMSVRYQDEPHEEFHLVFELLEHALDAAERKAADRGDSAAADASRRSRTQWAEISESLKEQGAAADGGRGVAAIDRVRRSMIEHTTLLQGPLPASEASWAVRAQAIAVLEHMTRVASHAPALRRSVAELVCSEEMAALRTALEAAPRPPEVRPRKAETRVRWAGRMPRGVIEE